MKLLKAAFFIMILCLIPFASIVAASDNLEGYDVTFLLPIDRSTPNHSELSVKIPKGYKSLQPSSTSSNANITLFIPEKEIDIYRCSESITINKFIGRQISASTVTTALHEQIAKMKKSTLLFQGTSNEGHEISTLYLKFIHEGKEAVMGMRFLSGPYDCVGVQYTINITNKMRQTEAVQKIESFFEQNLEVIQH